MHNHKFRYDNNERRKILSPEAILKLTELTSGMVFLDIGSNNGYFSLPAAQIIGPTGKVNAIDIDSVALQDLKDTALEHGIQNIRTFNIAAEDLKSHQFDSDIIFFGTVLHDLKDPLKALINARDNLVKDGIIYNLDWQKHDSSIGPPFEIRFSKEYTAELTAKAGLKIVDIQDIDENFYLERIVRE